MLRPDHAEILLERQLAATDWIEIAPPPGRDIAELRSYRDRLKEIRKRGAWMELLELKTPKSS